MRLLSAVVAAFVLAGPAAAACASRASQARLETQLVCPTCHTTLDQSDSGIAREMKSEIRRRIAACQTERQIRAAMVASFGPAILSTPQTKGFDLVAWVLPIGGALVAAAALAYGARTWSLVRAQAAPAPALEPEDERRVDEALRRYDHD